MKRYGLMLHWTARILIDSDSVKYYNKIEKTIKSDINYISDKIGLIKFRNISKSHIRYFNTQI